MGILDAMGMTEASKSKKTEGSQQSEFMVIGALIIFTLAVVVIKTAKYLPLIPLGLPAAVLIMDALRNQGAVRKTIVLLSNLAVLMSGYFLIFGSGFELFGRAYYGFLEFWPLQDTVGWFIESHDEVVGGYKKYFSKAVESSLITSLELKAASMYFWASLPVGCLLGGLCYIISLVRSKSNGVKIYEYGIASRVSSFLRLMVTGVQKPINWLMREVFDTKKALTHLVVFALIAFFLPGLETMPKAASLNPLEVLLLVVKLFAFFYTALMAVVFVRVFCLQTILFDRLVPILDVVIQPLFNGLTYGVRPYKEAKSGMTLGLDLNTNKPVALTEANLNYHVQIVGGSGAGKTNLIKNMIHSNIEQGKGLIFLDLKADFETVDWITKALKVHERDEDFELLSMSHIHLSGRYNPFSRGPASELHSMLMNAFVWSEEFYRKVSSQALRAALGMLCDLRDSDNREFTVRDIYLAVSDLNFLNDQLAGGRLMGRSITDAEFLMRQLEDSNGRKQLQGLAADLKNLMDSSAGSLLEPKGSETIDLFEAVQSKRVLYVLMDSMSDKESSELLGRLFLQDLIRTTGAIYNELDESSRTQTQVIIDEFASFASSNFIDFINRARGAGLGITVAHQSRGDLESVGEAFCDRLERNCATKLIFGTDSDRDAEAFASMTGTKSVMKDTRQMEDGLFYSDYTGARSRREVEEFVVHPNTIRRLGQGEVLKISRLVDPDVSLVKVFRAQEFEGVPSVIGPGQYQRHKPKLSQPPIIGGYRAPHSPRSPETTKTVDGELFV